MNSDKENNSKKDKKLFRDRKKERTRKTILIEAEKLFSEKSYNDVFLEDIAEAAFVSRATVYNYFKNKDDVFFAVGNQIFKELNETIATILPADLSGKDQFIFLCEKTFHDSIDKPIILKITREFFDRMNGQKLSAKEIYNDITEKVGPSTLNNLVENVSLLEEVDLAKDFDEPYFIEFFIQLLKNGNLWVKTVRKGKEDHTIKNDLEDMQIIQYVNVLMSGILYEMELRRTALDRINMKRGTFETNSLNLIASFLDKNA
ncbi:MAG: TetR/AcrR family transcriptional regulator [Candidatus Hodarchaeales archaeon]|jgi:AcrR family transcriptional regulator